MMQSAPFKSCRCFTLLHIVIALLAWMETVAAPATSVAAEPATEANPASMAVFERELRPLMVRLCVECHGPDKQQADLRLDTLQPNMVSGPDAETWHDVLNKLNLGEMPPKDSPQLTDAQRQRFTNWLTDELARAAAHRRSTGGRVVMRRLTRYEYANTMRDLLGLDLDYAKDLPPEPTSADGFQNNGASLRMSPLQLEYYLQIARDSLQKAIVTGPRPAVVTHHAEESEPIRRGKEMASDKLARSNRYLVRLNEFPREGRVAVRVQAAAVVPPGLPTPQLRVTLGVRADVLSPEKILAECDVTGTLESPQTFEFHGRIEDFPLPGHNPKYPGLLITLYNVTPMEKGAPQAKKNAAAEKTQADDTDESAQQAGNKNNGKQNNNQGKNNNKQKNQPEPRDLSNEPVIVIQSVDFEGPLLESWPPPSHTQIFFANEPREDEPAYAREVIERFMTRAFRRPVTESEVAAIYSFYEKIRPESASLAEAMRETLSLVLISPEFLYLVEPREQTAEKAPLTSYELASRLSYFLWSSPPDDELLQLAATGKLASPEVLQQQTQRLLSDPRASEFTRHFTSQWLDLPGVERVAVNPSFYPGFDDQLKGDMRRETQEFFAEILRENLSCLTLLDADFSMLNRRLAKHYGLPAPAGSEFERVTLPAESHRGGVLTQGSFLLSNSNGEDSHPIKRAVWLLDRLLDSPPAPPPPDVPDLVEGAAETAQLTLKARLEQHRQKESCNSCHRGIDPWGVAFENFDAVGRWRTVVQGAGRKTQPLDAGSTLPDGTTLDGVSALKAYLKNERRQQFARAVVKRLLAYSLGRSLELSDEAVVNRLSAEFAEQDYRLRELIVSIAQSEPFLSK